MAEKTKKGRLENALERNRKGIALVMGLAALNGVLYGGRALNNLNHKNKGPDKVYIAKPGDTEWTIAERAFPNTDVREEVVQLDSQLTHDAAHANHTIQPGDEFILPGDANIGKIVSSEK